MVFLRISRDTCCYYAPTYYRDANILTNLFWILGTAFPTNLLNTLQVVGYAARARPIAGSFFHTGLPFPVQFNGVAAGILF